MKKLLLPILLTSLLLTVDSAKCESQDGMFLLEAIKLQDSDLNKLTVVEGMKVGRLWGLIQGVQSAGQGYFFKTPDGWTIGQGVEILRKYLNDHPDLLNKHCASLVVVSFINAYPNKAESPKN